MELIEYLESKGLEVHSSGKNVSRGWLGVNCIFCPLSPKGPDPSWHLGIALDTGSYSCWRCGSRGGIAHLVYILENKASNKAETTLKKLRGNLTHIARWSSNLSEGRDLETQVNLPSQTEFTLLSPHRDFLLRRKFDPEYIFSKYNLGCMGPTDPIWKNRLIIPITYRKRLMAWVGRDISDQAGIKYKNSEVGESVISPKRCLYNIDNATDTVIVVEGVTDVWRIGDGAVATLGTQYTPEQVHWLGMFRRVFILFDSDAQELGERLAYDTSAIVSEVYHIRLDQGDPAELDSAAVDDLRREIFGKAKEISR